MQSVWVLTTEHNDHDQHGEYFVEVFREYPTFEQLEVAGVDSESLPHVKQGGGRTEKYEDQWWHLRKHNLK